jgi:GNAT superfamily N-acetyltransferase
MPARPVAAVKCPKLQTMIALRPARSDDYEFTKQIYYDTMRGIIEQLFGWDREREDKKFAAQFKLEDVRIITADGRDVGWIQTLPLEDSLYLGQFYVIPALQRRGIGSEILRRLIAEARGQGKAMTLSVVKINPVRKLYEAHGFRITHDDEYKYHMRLD